MILRPFQFVQTVGLVMLIAIGAFKFHISPSDVKKGFDYGQEHVGEWIGFVGDKIDEADIKMPSLSSSK